jgi:hypothetical protein
MSTAVVPSSTDEALNMLRSAIGFLADADHGQMPAQTLAQCLRALEQADAIGAAARGKMLAAFDAKDAHLADGQRTTRSWLYHTLWITRAQAREHPAVARLAAGHPEVLAGLREGRHLTKSAALQLVRWLQDIPERFRDQAGQIAVAAVAAGAGLAAVAAICAEIRRRTAPPGPGGPPARSTGWRWIPPSTAPGCCAVTSARSARRWSRPCWTPCPAPQGAGDLRTRPGRYHDALAGAKRGLEFCIVIWLTSMIPTTHVCIQAAQAVPQQGAPTRDEPSLAAVGRLGTCCAILPMACTPASCAGNCPAPRCPGTSG